MRHYIRAVLGLAAVLTVFGPRIAHAESILYVVSGIEQRLYRVSRFDASATLVGHLGFLGAGLAYDAGSDILYGSCTLSDNLYSIDRVAGSATLIGPFGVRLMHALAFDPSTRTLYGAHGGNLGFYRVDPATGAATLIGFTGYRVSGLAFDPATNVLYGSAFYPSQEGFLRIDPATGQATRIGNYGFNGIAFHPETGDLYGVANGALTLRKGLYRIDPSTGSAILIGPLLFDNPLDLEFVPEPGTCVLLGIGMVVLLGYCCRRVPRYAVNPFPKYRNTMYLGRFASQASEFARMSVAHIEVSLNQSLENTGNLGNAESRKG